ncbi:putative hydro-lyase [Curvibacter sp. HBC28]|uniref:Putative hydro-lyase PSQ39_12770 n=1 Tax=Curvibacter microcysteis TaxID=3026419 RepID=A0ABT5MFZ4_9BURK|nr:putative hydro-lyase [Curvibacter sp. HBC28]MDD0815501.1 putative hydro-lyase [Curvibacter sp. HBC28]
MSALTTAPSLGWQARQPIRRGEHQGHTSGLAPGLVQGNLMILPQALAADFLLFCQRNPKSCPLLAVSEPGDPFLPTLGQDIDIRSDVPSYRVWRDGMLVHQPSDLTALWQDDFVTFVLGCSFSFEQALIEAGIPLRHVQQGRNVAMYRTNVPTQSAGPFAGPMVVSMRPMTPADAIRAVQVTSRFAQVHGAPVHLGRPDLIGIADLAQPDFGDPVDIGPDEIPVFWACGVTPQSVAMATRPPLCITHSPGCMLVTDWLNHQLATG